MYLHFYILLVEEIMNEVIMRYIFSKISVTHYVPVVSCLLIVSHVICDKVGCIFCSKGSFPLKYVIYWQCQLPRL